MFSHEHGHEWGEMLAENHKFEVDMIVRTLTLYESDDPRVEYLKSLMFDVLSNHKIKIMTEQISEVQHTTHNATSNQQPT